MGFMSVLDFRTGQGIGDLSQHKQGSRNPFRLEAGRVFLATRPKLSRTRYWTEVRSPSQVPLLLAQVGGGRRACHWATTSQ